MQESLAEPPVDGGDGLGLISSVNGSHATPRLFDSDDARARVTVGKMILIATAMSSVVGVIARLTVASSPTLGDGLSELIADIDLLGEIKDHGTEQARFQRGVTSYPTIGDRLMPLERGDLTIIHRIADGETIDVGRLALDEEVPAYINFDDLLRKHFAVLGTTGVGKSTSVALILQQILAKKANLRVFLLDPHNEFANCFGDQANVISPKNLRLPFWLFNFEEFVDVIFRGRPGVEEETEILGELIPIAKAQYAAAIRGERVALRRVQSISYSADTPIPYRISDLVALINERMGRLENKSSWTKYHRLMARIETLGQDARYTFMFNNVFIEDVMVRVISDLFRLPANGKPITVMQLAGLPSEVVDSVVSVLCRMAFDFGMWSDGIAPLLVVCEEAHRYVPADRKLGFGPTRKALSRIAKEGRKYGVFLCIVTQRPADLDPTILSQCSTVFAMRMANDVDQGIVRAAVPDAGSSLLEFLASLGTCEAIAFGEGVALPTRFRFGDAPRQFLPQSLSGRHARFDDAPPANLDVIATVVERWRDATTTSIRPRTGMMNLQDAMDDGLGAPLVPRKIG